MNTNELSRAISNWTAEALAPYYGRHVAWAYDGKLILADGATADELYDEIDRLGLKEYVAGFVPDPNIAYY